MNKYHQLLSRIITSGNEQENKKGSIRYLLNERLELTPGDLLDIFEDHGIARKKLRTELRLFMRGERDVEKYRNEGITWWDYCGSTLVNSYPTYLEKLPPLIERINRERRNSKNYVLFLGSTDADPLPFMGQKRMFAKEFIKVLEHYLDNAVFVDLFGGSGLLSHITKCRKPDATVIYNDYDNYRRRLENIPRTNALLERIRPLSAVVPRSKVLPKEIKEAILCLIEQEERKYGYVDYITLSSSLLFSMKYATSLEELRKETFYNTIRKCDYNPCPDYLDGLEIVSCDYKELFGKYKNVQNVVFLIDPPYLSTEVGTYTMNWGLSDYLDVLRTLVGTNYIYLPPTSYPSSNYATGWERTMPSATRLRAARRSSSMRT